MASAPVNFVVTAAMYGRQVVGIVGAAVPLLDQVVRGVGAWLAADAADAVVAGDHRRRQLAPRLRAVGSVNGIGADALRPRPTERAMDRRLPGHDGAGRVGRFKVQGACSTAA